MNVVLCLVPKAKIQSQARAHTPVVVGKCSDVKLTGRNRRISRVDTELRCATTERAYLQR